MEVDTLDEGLATGSLRLACVLLGYEAAHLAEFRSGEHIIRAVHGPPEALGFAVGDVHQLEDTLCQRVVDGRAESFIADVTADRMARELIEGSKSPVAAYAGLPVRFPDGRLYGTLCAVDRSAKAPASPSERLAFQELVDNLGRTLFLLHRDRRVARERDELMQSVAHDLRTPLQALRFLGQDLAAGATESTAAGVQVDQEASRVLSMVEDMMLVTRHKAGTALLQPLPADVASLCREAIIVARGGIREGRHTIEEHLPDEPLMADVDANRIIRAVQNLLSNGVAYSPDGGTVTVRLTSDQATLLLEVSDEGMGIDPEDLGRVTARFYRSARAVRAGITGTGLGLTTVQAVADMHEGTLTIASVPGAGSTFTLRLPLRHRTRRAVA